MAQFNQPFNFSAFNQTPSGGDGGLSGILNIALSQKLSQRAAEENRLFQKQLIEENRAYGEQVHQRSLREEEERHQRRRSESFQDWAARQSVDAAGKQELAAQERAMEEQAAQEARAVSAWQEVESREADEFVGEMVRRGFIAKDGPIERMKIPLAEMTPDIPKDREAQIAMFSKRSPQLMKTSDAGVAEPTDAMNVLLDSINAKREISILNRGKLEDFIAQGMSEIEARYPRDNPYTAQLQAKAKDSFAEMVEDMMESVPDTIEKAGRGVVDRAFDSMRELQGAPVTRQVTAATEADLILGPAGKGKGTDTANLDPIETQDVVGFDYAELPNIVKEVPIREIADFIGSPELEVLAQKPGNVRFKFIVDGSGAVTSVVPVGGALGQGVAAQVAQMFNSNRTYLSHLVGSTISGNPLGTAGNEKLAVPVARGQGPTFETESGLIERTQGLLERALGGGNR